MTGEDGVEGPGEKSVEKAKKASLIEDFPLVTDRKPPERGPLIGSGFLFCQGGIDLISR